MRASPYAAPFLTCVYREQGLSCQEFPYRNGPRVGRAGRYGEDAGTEAKGRVQSGIAVEASHPPIFRTSRKMASARVRVGPPGRTIANEQGGTTRDGGSLVDRRCAVMEHPVRILGRAGCRHGTVLYLSISFVRIRRRTARQARRQAAEAGGSHCQSSGQASRWLSGLMAHRREGMGNSGYAAFALHCLT